MVQDMFLYLNFPSKIIQPLFLFRYAVTNFLGDKLQLTSEDIKQNKANDN